MKCSGPTLANPDSAVPGVVRKQGWAILLSKITTGFSLGLFLTTFIVRVFFFLTTN